MKIEIEACPYSPEQGLRLDFDEDHRIEVQVVKNEVVVAANTAGLVTFARALLNMAVHSRINTDAYFLELDNRLAGATSAADVRAVLVGVAKDLIANKMPY
jgi:hypothetical protein